MHEIRDGSGGKAEEPRASVSEVRLRVPASIAAGLLVLLTMADTPGPAQAGDPAGSIARPTAIADTIVIPPLSLPRPPSTRPDRPDRPTFLPLELRGVAAPPESEEPSTEVTPLGPEGVAAVLARLPSRTDGGPSPAPDDSSSISAQPTRGEGAPIRTGGWAPIRTAGGAATRSGGGTVTRTAAPAATRTGDPSPLSVVSVFPRGDIRLAPSIQITFSSAMTGLGEAAESVPSPPVELVPAPAGEWRWLDPRTLEFAPDAGRLDGATEYLLRVPDTVRSVDGAVPDSTLEYRFATEPPRVVGAWPAAEPTDDPIVTDPRPPLLLVFDQRVEPVQVARRARLDAADGGGYELRLGDLAMLERLEAAGGRDAGMAEAFRNAEPGTAVVLRPAVELPPGPASLGVRPGLSSLEGPRSTERLQTLAFRVRDGLELTGSDCPTDSPCAARGWVRLDFTNEIADGQPLGDLVRLNPAVANLRATAAGSAVYLFGDIRPDTEYTAIVGAELADRFGQRLGSTAEESLVIGHPLPAVQIVGGRFQTLDPASGGAIEITSRSVRSLDVSVYAVEPETWPAFDAARFEYRYSRDQVMWTPSSEPVWSRTVPVPGGGYGFSRTDLDLSDVLGDGIDHAVVVVELPDSAWSDPSVRAAFESMRYRRALAWVQGTDFVLGSAATPAEIVAWTVDLRTGGPAGGVTVRLPRAGTSAVTDGDGLARIPRGPRSDSLLVASRGGSTAILPASSVPGPAEWQPDAADFPQPMWFTLTDRGLYRPGETVTAKGWMREVERGEGGTLVVPRRTTSVAWSVISGRGRSILEGEAVVGASGEFLIEARLPSDAPTDRARLRVEALTEGTTVASSWTHEEWFSIEDFRRSEFEVRVTGDMGPHVAGDTFDITARGSYFDGGPIGGADVRWSTRSWPGGWTAPGWTGWSTGNAMGRGTFHRGGASPGWDGVGTTLDGVTDRDGRHTIRVALDAPALPYPAQISGGVRVQDLDRQVRTERIEALVLPADRAVVVRRPDRWVPTGSEVGIDVAVVDLDGAPTGARPRVAARLERDSLQVGDSPRVVPLDVRCSPGPTERVGDRDVRPFRCTTTAPDDGLVHFDAEIDDARGRTSRTTVTVEVLSATARPWWWASRGPGVDLFPDRERYVPGDTARIRIVSPFAPARGVVTILRHDLREIRPLAFDVEARDILVPIGEDDAGSIRVRVDLGTAGAGGRTASRSTSLEVDAESHRLAVRVVPEERTVAPGDEVAVAIEASDAEGRPVSGGDVVVWAVDESVLSLAGYSLPDPILSMHPRYRPVSLRFASPFDGVNWTRRSLGPGYVTGRIVDPLTGEALDGTQVRLEGLDAEPSLAGGDFTFAEVPAGTYRLVVTAGEFTEPILSREVVVPESGVDLGRLRIGARDPGDVGDVGTVIRGMSRGVSLRGLVVTGTTITAQRREVTIAATTFETLPAPPLGESGGPPLELRRDFRPLAAFRTGVRLDAEGRARVSIPLPETITRYRIFAVAAAGATRFGTGEATVAATRPLVVRASPPRTLHPGDRPELPVVVQNAGPETLRVDVAGRSVGMTPAGARGWRVSLPPGARREVRFPLEAEAEGNASFEVAAVGFAGSVERATDAVGVSVPIRPPMAPRSSAVHLRLPADSSVRIPVEIPGRAVPGLGRVELAASPSLLLPLADVIRDLWLEPARWPPQTIARLLAITDLPWIVEAIGDPSLPPTEDLRRVARDDADRLLTWIGPFRWSGPAGGAESNGLLLPITALQAVNALAEAERAGVIPDGTVRPWGQWVASQFEESTVARRSIGDRHDWMVGALALRVGVRLESLRPDAEFARWLGETDLQPVPVEALAWLLEAYTDLAGQGASAGTGETADSARTRLRRELENRLLRTGSTATFRAGETGRDAANGLDRIYFGSSRRADAIALSTWIRVGSDERTADALARGLVGPRDGSEGWPPIESGWVLQALGRHARGSGQETTDLTLSVGLPGRAPVEVRVGTDHPRALEGSPLPPPGSTGEITVSGRGVGVAWIRAGVEFTPEVTLDLPAEERGFLVSRSYQAVDDPNDVRRTEDGSWRIRGGARVRVRVAVTPLARRYRVVLEDPLPGGLEIVNPRLANTALTVAPGRGAGLAPEGLPVSPPRPVGRDLDALEMWTYLRMLREGWETHEDLRGDRYSAYTPLLPAGTWESSYLVRATTPGTFLVAPARAYETDAPEVYGQGRPDIVVVEAPGR